MAPKGQAKAKGKAARCKAAYTAEEARAQSSTAKRSRRGCGIAPSDAWLHESVQESLRANYGGMSDQEVGGTLVEGVTLVERLRRDKRAWCMEGVPALSQAYHNNNRRLYRTVRRKVDDLAVTGAKGNEQPVRDAVLEGLAMLKLRRPCRSALAALLAKKGLAFTQKELVYVCRAVAAQNPEASDGSLALVLACVGCFAREGLTASQPEEFACMREVLDRGLVVAMKAECTAPADTTALALLQDYKAQLGLFMNVDTAGRVLRASGDALVDLASSLTGICETSESGQFLLGWKVASVTVARVELLIKNKVEELLQGQISEATIETKREELAAELEGWYVEKGCWHPVSVRYRGVAVRMQVQTAMEHFDQCVSAAWQQLALSRGLLDCVGPEAQLGHLPASEGCGDVDPALLLSARRARQMAVEELAGAEDAATIAKVLKKAAAKLARKDLGSKVWSKFYFGLCDAASAEACLEARILETMPNKDRQLSLPQVLEQMNCLAKSGLARFVPKPCLRSIRLVLGLLGDLSMGSGCSPKSPTEFMAMVIERLQYFVVAETDKGKLYGGAAAAFHVAAIEREKDLQGEKVLTLLKDLNIFKHLLASNLQPKLTALTKEAEEQSNSAGAQAKATVKTMVAAASSNCTEGGSSSSAGGKPKTAKEKRKASAMELALVDFCF
mmetsp:Transcript_61072/g.189663  ORF Transcript_61072/g.189663 Transcript_61072/m.189663 type:complete len:674 (+) Transcript_61072:66-2087(+)